MRVHNADLGRLGTHAHKAAALKLEVVHSVLWSLYASRHPLAAAHRYAALEDVRAVAPWVGELYSEATAQLYPAEAGQQLEALRCALLRADEHLQGHDSVDLVCALVSEALGTTGQPVNLDVLSATKRRIDQERAEERARGNAG